MKPAVLKFTNNSINMEFKLKIKTVEVYSVDMNKKAKTPDDESVVLAGQNVVYLLVFTVSGAVELSHLVVQLQLVLTTPTLQYY